MTIDFLQDSSSQQVSGVDRRTMLRGGCSALLASGLALPKQAIAAAPSGKRKKAQIAITLDLEMSRHYPKRGQTEWDYQKGNLDSDTKNYSVQAAEIAKQSGGVIHFFCVGRVLEHASVEWLQRISEGGHAIGNHTYDHVNVRAKSVEETQFRFRRSPWLVAGKTAADVIRENIRLTSIALKQRAGIDENGFRTPGGFHDGISAYEDVQRMLLDLGFHWASCKYPRHQAGEVGKPPTAAVYADIVRAHLDAQPFAYPSGLIEIPMSPISDVNAFRTKRWKLEHFLVAVRQAVEWAIENRGVFDFLCHPSCMVIEDPEFKTIRLICDLVRQHADRAEIVTLDQIASQFTTSTR